MRKIGVIVLLCLSTVLCVGCKYFWGKTVDKLLNSKKMEQLYGKPRTTFLTCPVGPDDAPRMPVAKPVELMKFEDGWNICSTDALKGDSIVANCGPVDLIYGDSLYVYCHIQERHDTIPFDYHYPENWIVVEIKNLQTKQYASKALFAKGAGQEILNKMVSPDEYYAAFKEDENALPWIPNE